MKSKKPPIFSLLGSLKWETGDTLVWTGTKFMLNGKVLEESEMLKKGVYADSGLEESAKYQDALNKAHYQKQEQLKPSVWIRERAKEYGPYAFERALEDFLDSVAEGKYKL